VPDWYPTSPIFLCELHTACAARAPRASIRSLSAKGTGRNAVSHYDCLDFDALAKSSVVPEKLPNVLLMLVNQLDDQQKREC
jgi:hypothetical protein